jgi:L-ornithine N5-oxygenase
MRRTNYAGVTPEMLDSIYQQMYLERLQGNQRLHMVTMVDVIGAKVDGDEVVLNLAHRMGKPIEDLRCDVLMLGTGFEVSAPPVVQSIAATAGLDSLNVSRTYRLDLPEGATAGCYLQGTNEATHGIADSLISVLAIRAGEIVEDLLAHRPAPIRLKTVATAA